MIGCRGRDSPNGSLCLVTGCIKSRNWAIAIFHENSSHNCVQLVSNEGSGTPYCWEKMGNVIVKTGPRSILNISKGEEPNQCTFLRGYKITLRQDLWSLVSARSHHGKIFKGRADDKTSNQPRHGASSSQSLSAGCNSNPADSSMLRDVGQNEPDNMDQDMSDSKQNQLEEYSTPEVMVTEDLSTASPVWLMLVCQCALSQLPGDSCILPISMPSFYNWVGFIGYQETIKLKPLQDLMDEVAPTHDSEWSNLLPEVPYC